VNPRTRKAALYATAVIAILASANALAHSYAGLYDWAAHHRLTGWQAMSWPAEIDVFLAVGELALYVAYLDGWPTRQRIWPWATTVVGLVVSVAGNVGHIQPVPGHPVMLADRLTAAASPLAAFAGLTVGLLVLRMNRLHATTRSLPSTVDHVRPVTVAPERGNGHALTPVPWVTVATNGVNQDQAGQPTLNEAACTRAGSGSAAAEKSPLLKDAALIYQTAAARGEQLSQRALARTLRGRGHRFPNQSLRSIAKAIGLDTPSGHISAAEG
jgi:hypothetical protein